MPNATKQVLGKVAGDGPAERLKGEFRNLIGAVGDRAMDAARDKLGGAAERLGDYAEQGGGPGLMAAVTGAKDLAEGKSPTKAMFGAGMSGLKGSLGSLFGKGKGKGGKGKKQKITNIIETIDVGAPVRVVYNQWTQFRDFPSFMKKVENVDQQSDEKLHWKAQIFWSHREWESTIVQQVPDKRIVWRSKGPKGSVDGAVTFHETGPDLTRVVLVLEYHPQGLFEKTGNIWRAQGRRARLELKHFRRHVMTQAMLHPDDIEGWRGEIQDGEVVRDHETAVEEEQRGDGAQEADEPQDSGSQDAEPEDSAEPEDAEPENAEPEDSYEAEDSDEPEEEPEPEPVGARRGRGRRQPSTRSRRSNSDR